MAVSKELSPFTPGRPVPPELFVGRTDQIERVTRAARQVRQGRQENLFITGEYGIGKSSLASVTCYLAEQEYGLAGFHVFLAGAQDVQAAIAHIVDRIAQRAYRESRLAPLKSLFAKYVRQVELFGVQIDFQAIRQELAAATTNLVPFLRSVWKKLQPRWKGITLVLDDLNGITSDPRFPRLLKSTVDEIATSRSPLPLLLMLAGVHERRNEMIQHQPSTARVFDIVEVEPLDDLSVREFFEKAFASVGISVHEEAYSTLTYYSAGLPRLMHELGDAAFWSDNDGTIDRRDAFRAVELAAESVGRKYFQPIFQALRSQAYRTILRELAAPDLGEAFRVRDLASRLGPRERAKLGNFIQRMKKLGALLPGEHRGEWRFPDRLVRIYLQLEAASHRRASRASR